MEILSVRFLWRARTLGGNPYSVAGGGHVCVRVNRLNQRAPNIMQYGTCTFCQCAEVDNGGVLQHGVIFSMRDEGCSLSFITSPVAIYFSVVTSTWQVKVTSGSTGSSCAPQYMRIWSMHSLLMCPRSIMVAYSRRSEYFS